MNVAIIYTGGLPVKIKVTVRTQVNGQRKTMAEWGEVTGIGADTIESRINRLGWDVVRTLTTPKRILPPRKKVAA